MQRREATPREKTERRGPATSHHLDTPLAAQSGQLYIDDLYVFPGDGTTVMVMNVNSNVTGKRSEPSFHPEARYELKVHLDGAAYEDLTYRLSFEDADSEGHQAFQLHLATGADAREDSAVGDLVLEGRSGAEATAADIRVWAGRISDAFYIDLSLLAIVDSAVGTGTALDLTKWDPAKAQNSFANTTVDSIVVEISHQHRQLCPGAHIGLWGATKLATDAGGWRQVNRAGHPMMWPIFWPNDTQFTNPANARHPSEDADAVGKVIADLIAATVAASGTSGDPRGYGDTVARELFPDVLSYVIGTPAVYGFATRNGRSLADNAPEAMLSLVTNTAVPSGLKPAVAEKQRSSRFPYVVPA